MKVTAMLSEYCQKADASRPLMMFAISLESNHFGYSLYQGEDSRDRPHENLPLEENVLVMSVPINI